MKKPLELKLRIKLFFWFMLAGIWSLFDPDFGHKIVTAYADRLDFEQSRKINKLHR